ncbi:MAG: 4Fe-4S dicluster domain-containing protein [Planctomycetaceae bacterium]|nr:4Fe-4S dicluster domain-containing protein [Planctomycetaceae bacterium]
MESENKYLLPKQGLQDLILALKTAGYLVIGPKIDQEAIVYDEIESIEDLPRGWTDLQAPGQYRLKKRDDDAYFGYVVGPRSLKQYLYPPRQLVATATRDGQRWEFEAIENVDEKYAFIGVRACEIAAMRVQDRVFLEGAYVDPLYAKRRESALIVAVNCTMAASTCFCTSMGTGPRCNNGFDLALTELADAFVIEAGSEKGEKILRDLPSSPVTTADLDQEQKLQQQAVDQISKTMNPVNLREDLLANLDHDRWAETAQRCLSCANCTMVCPTCFCTTVEEVSDLTGDNIERQRNWDSCFDIDFSYQNGAIVRDDVRSRYRQWLTHKLATWHDQFDQSGCVGCGRCITWCPVGIDLTEEVAAIRGNRE